MEQLRQAPFSSQNKIRLDRAKLLVRTVVFLLFFFVVPLCFFLKKTPIFWGVFRIDVAFDVIVNGLVFRFIITDRGALTASVF